MTRCPKTARPHQFRGRAKYRFAGVTFQCVLEEGHAGPCGMEPVPKEPSEAELHEIGCSLFEKLVSEIPGATAVRVSRPQTPEQIAAGDARYREHLRRKRRG